VVTTCDHLTELQLLAAKELGGCFLNLDIEDKRAACARR
jgi:hypothetical protein